MKRHTFSLTFVLLFLSAALLGGCGSGASENSGIPTGNTPDTKPSSISSDPEQNTQDSAAPLFPKAESFVDDTGRSMQRNGDYLYSYYDGRLMRTRKDSGETALLYQTSANSRLRFCLYKDFIYFVERAGYDSPDNRDTALYRMDKDGSDLTLLQDDIPNAAPLKFITYWGAGKYDIDEYDIDIYDDIIYLLNYTYNDTYDIYDPQSEEAETEAGNLYFRLEDDGSVSQLPESDTLYGSLPEGFSEVRSSDRPIQPEFPSLPYFMRNYGCLFVRDTQDILWRIDPVNDIREKLSIAATDLSTNYVFSGDAILLYSHSGGGLFLFRLSDKTMIPLFRYASYETDSCSAFSAREGFFYCDKYHDETGSALSVKHILPDGSYKSLLYCSLSEENLSDFSGIRYDSCFFENYFYYFVEEETSHALMRISVKEDPDTGSPLIEQSDSWYVYPAVSAPAKIITEEKKEKIEPGNACSVSFDVKKLFLEEQTDADKLINEFLIRDAYADFEEHIEDTVEEQHNHIARDPAFYEQYEEPFSVDFSLTATCDYMDDDTISFCCAYYEYFSDTVHSSHWCTYYTFDRHTGRRLSFEDFVEDTDLILTVAVPYVENKAEWGFSPESVLEPDRFSLSADGYMVHFSPYEIGPYAAGHISVTIPYEAFEKNQ